MHGHARVNPERGAELRQRQPLLVETMAGFVNRAEERIERRVGIKARCHSHVAARPRKKRMERHIDPPARVVEAHPLGHFAQKHPLTLHRKPAQLGRRRPRPRRHRRSRDLAHERHEFAFQLVEQFLHRRRRQTGVVLVEHVVVGRVTPPEIGGLAFRQLKILLQHRRITGEIVRRFRPRPRMVAAAAQRGLFAHELRRQFCRAIVVAPRIPDDGPLIRRQFTRRGFQFHQQLAQAWLTRRGVLRLRERGMLHGPLVGATGRQVDLLVPAEQLAHRAECVGPFDESDEFRARGVRRHARQPERPCRGEASALSPFTPNPTCPP